MIVLAQYGGFLAFKNFIRKYISCRAEGEERFIRTKSLGADYTEEQIRNRISGARRIDISESGGLSLIIDIENAFNDIQGNKAGLERWAVSENLKRAAATYNFLMEHGLTTQEELDAKIISAKQSQDDSRSRIKEIEARLKVISEDIQNIDNYRKTKPVADKLKTAVFKDKFRRENEGDLIIHDAAERYIRKRFPDGKLPLIKSLRAEQRSLYKEKEKLYQTYHTAKDELSELQTAEKNLAALLGRTVAEQDKTVHRKKNGELE